VQGRGGGRAAAVGGGGMNSRLDGADGQHHERESIGSVDKSGARRTRYPVRPTHTPLPWRDERSEVAGE
jgi:hypothetical protein